MMSYRFNIYILLSVIFIGCASTNTKKVDTLRSHIVKADYNSALTIVNDKEFYSNKKSALLKRLEQGRVFFLKGDYLNAIKYLFQAQEISNKLYTVSISKKVTAAISNDSQDNYYGEIYERSLIRLFLALSHYHLYFKDNITGIDNKIIILNSKLKNQHLQSARAVVLEWDSLLDGYRKNLGSEAVYKYDLTLKLFGAIVHETFGTRSQINIAKQLYKDAKLLLIKNYGLYPSYNHNFKKYRKEFDTLHKLKIKKVKSDFISDTDISKKLQKFIDKQIIRLKKRKDSNIIFFIENNLISMKQAKKIDVPIGIPILPVGVNNKKDFLSFTSKVLAIGSATKPTVSFELPSLVAQKSIQQLSIIIKDSKNLVVKEVGLVLTNPLSEIAELTLQTKLLGIKTRVGLRVAAKHLAALGSSYIAYRKSQEGGSGFLGLAIATGMYSVANQGIKESERADLRAWSTLPDQIWLGQDNLKKGSYMAYLKTADKVETKISNFIISDKTKKTFINFSNL